MLRLKWIHQNKSNRTGRVERMAPCLPWRWGLAGDGSPAITRTGELRFNCPATMDSSVPKLTKTVALLVK